MSYSGFYAFNQEKIEKECFREKKLKIGLICDEGTQDRQIN